MRPQRHRDFARIGREITVPLWAHSLASCPLPTPANLDLSALGDFAVTNRTSEYLSLDAAGTKLAFPENTLALEASVSTDLSQQSFIGYSERGVGRFDFLLWPQGTACDLFRPSANDSFPGKLGGEAIGYAPSTGLVLAAGSNDANSAAIVGALTFDARTGESHLVDPSARAVLSQPRAFATVTDFSGAVLVAGGENPIHDASEPASVLRDTAEIYDPVAQSFEPDSVPLAEAVTHHAAIVLKTGETALFGGRNQLTYASNVVQVVSPATRIAKLLKELAAGRNSPNAIRLDDDRVLIGGGTDEDGHPVASLEWREVDAGSLPAPFDGSVSLPPRFGRAFVALPGGAALAVGGCEDRPPRSGEDCASWCEHGCPPTPDPTSGQSYDAYWLAPDGTTKQLDFPLFAPRPLLLSGSDGRPWLIATGVDADGNGNPRTRALYRFDPWQQRFDPIELDLGFNETLDPTRIVATGPDAFVWLGSDGSGSFTRGVRLGTRSAYASDVALVSLSEDFARPAHLSPDHVPSADVVYDAGAGTLILGQADADAPPDCVWVADAKYGDFSAKLTFTAGAMPALSVGRTRIDLDAACAPPALTPATTELILRRAKSLVTLDAGATTTRCELADGSARIPLGLCRSSAGSSRVTGLAITRGD